MIKRLKISLLILIFLPQLVYGAESFILMCTGSVHGEVDPCG